MQRFKKAVFWLHLVTGLVGGIVIFIMCVTGAALSFEKNILESIERDQRYVAVGESRVHPSEILARVGEARPGAKASSMVMQADPAAAVSVSLGREGVVFVDPYTGAITGEGSKPARAFFGTTTDIHRWLAMSGDGRWLGKAITGACNLMFLALAITGIYIWFPRGFTRRHLRPRIWFREGAIGKARDFNWHTTIGFWSSLVLVILTVTAAVISYKWAGDLVYTVTGNEVPKPQQQAPASPPQDAAVPADIDAMWAAASVQSRGWRSISLRLPVGKEANFTIDEGKDLNIFGRGSLALDPATAQVVKWEPYAQKNSASQLRTWMRFTHTGESFGIIGQFIGFLACIGGAVLVYTGSALAIRRLAAFRRKRARAAEADGGSRSGRLEALET